MNKEQLKRLSKFTKASLWFLVVFAVLFAAFGLYEAIIARINDNPIPDVANTSIIYALLIFILVFFMVFFEDYMYLKSRVKDLKVNDDFQELLFLDIFSFLHEINPEEYNRHMHKRSKPSKDQDKQE